MKKHTVALLLPLLLAGCAGFAGDIPINGYEAISAEEAAWRQVAPRLPGMSEAAIERCAGRPLSAAATGPGQTTLVYRAQDLRNYCQVALAASNGTVTSVSADYQAPEFMWLRDGTNYCGRIFMECAR